MNPLVVVHKNTSLGLLWPHATYSPLNGKVTLGGMSSMDSPVMVNAADVRPATVDDFETFKVVYNPDYHLLPGAVLRDYSCYGDKQLPGWDEHNYSEDVVMHEIGVDAKEAEEKARLVIKHTHFYKIVEV